MTWRTTPDIQEATTLITLNGKDLDNVRSFRNLGHWLTDDPKHPKYLNQQVGAAQGAWSIIEGSILSRILTCIRELKLRKRVYVHGWPTRCRVTASPGGSVVLWTLYGCGCYVIWCRGGFARNGPDSTRFTLPNASILSACNTRSASSFCQQQHLRYLAHVCRMENDALKKQLLFAPPRKKEVSHWKRLQDRREPAPAHALQQEGGKRVATGNTWRTLIADMPVQQHEWMN